jgi:exodeoxyribonuclease V alpha subunit
MNQRAPQDGHALARLLGDTLAELATGGDGDLLRATVALLCQEREQGHVCVALADWSGQSIEGGTAAPFPAVARWREQLQATGLCGAGDDARPLVLDGKNRLYLLRHWRTEQQLLAFLRQRLSTPAPATADALAHTFETLDMRPRGEPDWQLVAITAAVHRSCAVWCGGPGTGKTSTVVRLLAVLLHQAPNMRIALCAPTGRAAARLGEALRANASAHPELAAAIAEIVPRTLHRLLGYLPLEDSFRFGPVQPLPFDAVIVDEVSMVDPAVLAVLCSALRPRARLLLVGDKDQLAAIAAGQVLGDLCRAARPELGVGAELAGFVAEATGMKLPVQQAAAPIANATIALRENHRFGRQPGIGAFAQALMLREPATALQALVAGHDDLLHLPDATRALAAIEPVLRAQASCRDPDSALRSLGNGRILTASRHGPNGALAWNQRVHAMLRPHGHRTDDAWYEGRPILVTANDYQNELWNGDLGVACRGADGKLAVWFPSGNGPRRIAITRLPPHETAWAMTVHKAQGSEFDEILLVMPDRPGPLWQASLVYTGVTRARRRAIVCADLEQLGPCLQRWPQRSSGLVEGLATQAPASSPD